MFNIDNQKLQTLIISLRIYSTVSRDTGNQRSLQFKNPFRARSSSGISDDWEKVIISMLETDHIWEAHAVLDIYLGNIAPSSGSDLRQIPEAVSRDNDTMYTLVKVSMLTRCIYQVFDCESRSSEEVAVWSDAFRTAAQTENVHMDNTLDTIGTSRAFTELVLLACYSPPSLHAHRPWSLAVHSFEQKYSAGSLFVLMQRRAVKNEDFELVYSISKKANKAIPEWWRTRTGIHPEAAAFLYPISIQTSRATPEEAASQSSALDREIDEEDPRAAVPPMRTPTAKPTIKDRLRRLKFIMFTGEGSQYR